MLNYHIHGNNCVIPLYMFKNTDSNDNDGEEVKPTILKNVDRLTSSRAGKIARQLTNMAKDKASKLSKEFKNSLIEDSKNQVNGKNLE